MKGPQRGFFAGRPSSIDALIHKTFAPADPKDSKLLLLCKTTGRFLGRIELLPNPPSVPHFVSHCHSRSIPSIEA